MPGSCAPRPDSRSAACLLSAMQGPVALFMDRGLFRFMRVWVAAGSPFSVFAIEPERLRDAAGARVADLRVA